MISCLNPQILINPAVYEAVSFSTYVSCNGVKRYFNGVSRLFRRPLYEYLKALKDNITHDNIKNFFTTDRLGNIVNLFIAVPCRKCLLCQQSDENEIAQRLQMESELYPCEPYFVTLTFAPHSLPRDNNPTIRHLETYMKRLRNYTDELGYSIRFYGQGEHGKKFGRAHLHLLIFGLPDMPHSIALDLFQKAWLTKKVVSRVFRGQIIKQRLPIGHVYVSQINDPNYRLYYEQKNHRPLLPADGLRYCCKYASKASHCRSWSKGLGKPFALRFRSEMHKIASLSSLRSDWNLVYRNKYGQPSQIIMSRWFLHSVFNTFNRSTYYFRKRLYDHIIFIVSTKPDYINRLDRLPTKFVGVVPELVDKHYCAKIFSDYRQKATIKGHSAYLKLLRSLASDKFVDRFLDIPIEQLAHETNLYNNFCNLYFANRELSPEQIQLRKYEREKYLNKSLTLQTI